MQAQTKFLSVTGDHETLLNVYEGWMKAEEPEQFCDLNFLNFRGLRQSDNIKNQLFEILSKCRIDVCQRFYRDDKNWIEYQ